MSRDQADLGTLAAIGEKKGRGIHTYKNLKNLPVLRDLVGRQLVRAWLGLAQGLESQRLHLASLGSEGGRVCKRAAAVQTIVIRVGIISCNGKRAVF